MDTDILLTATVTPITVAMDGTIGIGITTIGVITGADGIMTDGATVAGVTAVGAAMRLLVGTADGVADMGSGVATVDGMVVAGTLSRTQAAADTIAADPDWASNLTGTIV
jgi:hypothetical protein